jgi:predicted anti-sigma-YlaC factor YlaD
MDDGRMDCTRCQEALSARLDGENPGSAWAEAEAHHAGCPECAAWLETALVLRRVAETGAEPGAGGADRVLRALRGAGATDSIAS